MVTKVRGASSQTFTSRSKLKLYDAPVGTVIWLSEGDRSGEFVVKDSISTSDPKEGIYIELSNGNYAMRRYDGVSSAGGVDIRWFVESTDTDETSATQAAVTYAESEITGTVAVKWQGQIQLSSTINVASNSIIIRGVNWYRDIAYYSGTGYAFDFAGGENRLENLRLLANPVVAKSNSAINSGGNLTMSNVWISGFDAGVTWGGGFYHKYYNCKFIDVDYPLDSFNGNNFLASGCQFALCIDVCSVKAGTGNMTFFGGSCENVSGDCFKQSSGTNCSYNIDGVYFEGFGEILVASRGTHVFTNNNIQVTSAIGCIRMAGADAANPVSIHASGNKWIVASDGLNNVDFIYKISGERESAYIRDFWVPIGTSFGGAYTTELLFVSSGFTSLDVVDPISGIKYGEPWIPLALLNSWGTFGSGANLDLPAYKVSGGVLYLKGKLLRDPATADTFASLTTDIVQYLSTEDLTAFTASGLEGSISKSTGDIKLPTGTGSAVLDIAIPLTR